MKYKGKEIGKRPTIEMVEECIKTMGLTMPASMVYDRYNANGWKTLKGKDVESIESVVVSINSNWVSMKKREAKKEAASELKKKKSEWKRRLGRIKKDDANKKEYINYTRQLNDPRWKAFRTFVFAVRGKRCEVCGSNECLQVHHLHYRDNAMAWEYTTKEVAVLCKNCHSELHSLKL